MNEKANVSKELNARHRKVRSATLDTWLPEQVAFIQSMGNELANSFWEAELPPNYDGVGIENFIRAKYEEKRWVPKDGKHQHLASRQDVDAFQVSLKNETRNSYSYSSTNHNAPKEGKVFRGSILKGNVENTKVSLPTPPSGPIQVRPMPKVSQVGPKSAPLAVQEESIPTAVASSNLQISTDLFDMLSMDDPIEDNKETESIDDWAGFQSAGSAMTEKPGSVKEVVTDQTSLGIHNLLNGTTTKATNSGEQRVASMAEDLFSSVNPDPDTPKVDEEKHSTTEFISYSMTGSPPVAEKLQNDVKNDIMSLFEKSNTVSPFALHQQQLAMLAYQQSLMAAAAKSKAEVSYVPGSTQQPDTNVSLSYLPKPNWPQSGIETSGLMAEGLQNDLVRLMQVGNVGQQHFAANMFQFPTSSGGTTGKGSHGNGGATSVANTPTPPVTTSMPSVSGSQSGSEYDFSSLTKDIFAKH